MLVTKDQFQEVLKQARNKSELHRNNLNEAPSDGIYLSEDGAGVSISDTGEIGSLFNIGIPGNGLKMLRTALQLGGTHLNTFATLEGYYKRAGFYTYRVEDNWDGPNFPKVVFMAKKQTVLHLFQGGGTATIPMIESGKFQVIYGPDLLFGHDISEFRGVLGSFDGIIGGPPCQGFSRATRNKSRPHTNKIPEFLRIVQEVFPKWAVMENVTNAPFDEWPSIEFRDSDVGGKTKRYRRFWFYGISVPEQPKYNKLAYKLAEPTIMASSWRSHGWKDPAKNTGIGQAMLLKRTLSEAAELQGFLRWEDNYRLGVPAEMLASACNMLGVHMLGNGLPYAMGKFLSDYLAQVYELTLP